MLKKLRWKFVGITMLIVTLMLGVIFGVLYHFTSVGLKEDSMRMMRMIADDPFRMGRPGEQADNVQLPYFTIQMDVLGNLIATSGGYYDLSDREYLLSVLEAAEATGEDTAVLRQYNLRFSRIRTPKSECLVFVDLSSEQATLRNLLQTSMLLGLLTLAVFFAISLLLARWAVKPVDEAWQQQKQFVADASHELKTPLTVIMTNAELLQEAEASPEQSRCTEGIVSASRQMRGLVDSLLELARVDHGASALTKTPTNLSLLAEDMVLTFEPLYFEAERTLAAACEPELTINGSAPHLQQVMEILLDNAMKYSFPHTQVDMALKRQGSGVLLSVSSMGDPITPQDLKNIFKRFYRVDAARPMSGSYGLGLPIAETIVHAHRGKIWAESESGRTTFLVWLPR